MTSQTHFYLKDCSPDPFNKYCMWEKRNLDWWARIVISTYRFMSWGNNVIMQRKMKWCLWAVDEQHRVFVLSMSLMWKVAGKTFYEMLIVLQVHKSQSNGTLCVVPLRGIFSIVSDSKMHCCSSRIFLQRFSRFIFLTNCSLQQYTCYRIILFYKSLFGDSGIKISLLW